MSLCQVQKIISGGQIGADRAGLDFAIEHGIEHGGHCPKGRIAEDGTVPMKYRLVEAVKPGYPYRTKLNVMHSDATVIFTGKTPGRGSALTISACLDFGKPYLVINPEMDVNVVARNLKCFLEERPAISILNVAGSRPQEFYDLAHQVLEKTAELCAPRKTTSRSSLAKPKSVLPS